MKLSSAIGFVPTSLDAIPVLLKLVLGQSDSRGSHRETSHGEKHEQ